jgi:hypothetical protein
MHFCSLFNLFGALLRAQAERRGTSARSRRTGLVHATHWQLGEVANRAAADCPHPGRSVKKSLDTARISAFATPDGGASDMSVMQYGWN